MRFKGEIVKTMLMALVVGTLLWATPGFTQGFKGFGGGFKGFGGKGFGRGMGGYRGRSGFNNMNGRNRIVDVAADLDDLLDPNTTLKPYATVEGTVFGEDGKTPASGITVTISRQDSKGEYKVNSGKDGKYSYDGLPDGEYVMGVIYNQATKTSKDGDAGLLRDAKLRIGRVVKSDFDLKEFVSMGKPGSFDDLKNKFSKGQNGDGEDLTAKLSLENQELYDKARDAADKGDFATAAKILEVLVQREPKEAVFWNRLAEAYLMLKKYPEGVAASRHAVELKPENPSYAGNLAMGLLFADKIDEATIYTEKTAALDPKRGAAAYFNLGLALTDKGDSKQAETAFEKSTKLDSTADNADSFYQLGITQLSTHTIPPLKITDAIPHLDQARKWLEKDPEKERQEMAQTAAALIAEISKPATTSATNAKAAAPSTNNGKAASGTKK